MNMPDETDLDIKPPTRAETCPFTTTVWSLFITKFSTRIRLGAMDQRFIDEWAVGARAPYISAWERMCRMLGLPFEELLLIIATFDIADDDPSDRREEMKWRRTTLRSFYGRVNPKYYPVLDRLLSRKIDVKLSSKDHIDLRDHVKELDELRRFKWAKLVAPLKTSIATKRPPAVELRIRHDKWVAYITGKDFPPVNKAGIIAEALGLDYDATFEVYCCGELVSDLNFTQTYRNTLNSMRVRFNKGWSPEVRHSANRRDAVASRKRESRVDYVQKRNASLIEAFESAVRRSLDLTEAGNHAAAGLAKIEAQSLNSAMVSMGVPHSTVGYEEQIAQSLRPKKAKDGYMRLSPVTGRMEHVAAKVRVEPIPYEDDEPIAYEEAAAPLPPPPPPPPPPIPDLLEITNKPRQVLQDEVPPSLSAILEL